MRCLVTGASGFLGSWLVRQLLQDGHSVMAVVRRGGKHPRLTAIASQLEFAYADLSTIPSIAAEVQHFGPDVAFHLAWQGGNSSKFVNDPEQVYSNVPGTLELVRIAHEVACKGFFFFGSSVEYGTYRIPVRETDVASPRNLYGYSKHAMMQLTQALSEKWGMRFCGIRPFWTYGPIDDELRMIPYVIRQFLGGNRPKVTAGEQLWDFLYVEDAVRALVGLAASEDATGIFNLGSGSPRPLKNVIYLIRDLIDPQLEIGFGEIPYSPDQVMHLEADISKLRSATGWKPEISLEEGLRRTVEWYRYSPMNRGCCGISMAQTLPRATKDEQM
jgi:nucleoside-diphosphate-sugar epimerase